MNIIDWLARVPTTFWAVVAGSFFSLGGVWLSNRNSRKNLQTQLDHDRQVRTVDREMAIRRDIYLAAAEALSAGFIAVERFGDIKLEPDEIVAPFIEKAPAIAKINIVGSIETLKGISAVTSALNAAYMHLHGERIPAQAIKSRYGVVSRQLETLLLNQTRSVEMMKEENFKGRPDGVRWNAIQANFAFESAEIKTQLAEQIELERAMGAEQLRLTELAMEQMKTLNTVLAPLVCSVRVELGLPIDEPILRAMFLDAVEDRREGLTALIARVREENAKRKQSTETG